MDILKPKNNVKQIAFKHYKSIANALVGYKLPEVPKEGWVRTVRKALGMSGAQLGERVGVSRNRISVLERKEVNGEITLKQLQHLAEQLNCDLTYALVPRKPVEAILEDKVTKLATQELTKNSQHMYLEAQSINQPSQDYLLEQVKESILSSGGRVIWRKTKE